MILILLGAQFCSVLKPRQRRLYEEIQQRRHSPDGERRRRVLRPASIHRHFGHDQSGGNLCGPARRRFGQQNYIRR